MVYSVFCFRRSVGTKELVSKTISRELVLICSFVCGDVVLFFFQRQLFEKQRYKNKANDCNEKPEYDSYNQWSDAYCF